MFTVGIIGVLQAAEQRDLIGRLRGAAGRSRGKRSVPSIAAAVVRQVRVCLEHRPAVATTFHTSNYSSVIVNT